jgi:hypothetical protein
MRAKIKSIKELYSLTLEQYTAPGLSLDDRLIIAGALYAYFKTLLIFDLDKWAELEAEDKKVNIKALVYEKSNF